MGVLDALREADAARGGRSQDAGAVEAKIDALGELVHGLAEAVGNLGDAVAALMHEVGERAGVAGETPPAAPKPRARRKRSG